MNGKAAIAIEARKLGTPLGAKEAGQVVAYCSNLGVRWGAVTDGRYFKLYDAPMLGVPPEERQVLSVNLADYKDRDDFEARIYPELELIAKPSSNLVPAWSGRVALWLHGLAVLGWIVGLLVMALALSARPGVFAEPLRRRLSRAYRRWGAWLHWGL